MNSKEAFRHWAAKNSNYQEERDAAAAAWEQLSEAEQEFVNEHIGTDFSEALDAVALDASMEGKAIMDRLNLPDYKWQFDTHHWALLLAEMDAAKYRKLHFAHFFGYQDNDAVMGYVRERLFEGVSA